MTAPQADRCAFVIGAERKVSGEEVCRVPLKVVRRLQQHLGIQEVVNAG